MPSRFTGSLKLEHLDADWRLWKLLEPLIWEVDELGSRRVFEVPTGYVTNLASTPRLVWAFFPPTGAYARPAALHDRALDLIRAGTPHEHIPTFREAHTQFRLAMAAVGVAAPVRWIMWAAVSLFGNRK